MLFVFDENLPPTLCAALNLLEQSNFASPIKVKLMTATELMGRDGATDEELIVGLGKVGGILITQDTGFKKQKHRYNLYKQHGVGVVLYQCPVKDVFWDKVISFVNNWEKIKQHTKNSEIPFGFVIGKSGGVSPLSF